MGVFSLQVRRERGIDIVAGEMLLKPSLVFLPFLAVARFGFGKGDVGHREGLVVGWLAAIDAVDVLQQNRDGKSVGNDVVALQIDVFRVGRFKQSET